MCLIASSASKMTSTPTCSFADRKESNDVDRPAVVSRNADDDGIAFSCDSALRRNILGTRAAHALRSPSTNSRLYLACHRRSGNRPGWRSGVCHRRHRVLQQRRRPVGTDSLRTARCFDRCSCWKHCVAEEIATNRFAEALVILWCRTATALHSKRRPSPEPEVKDTTHELRAA